jgi:hypothetical protein
MHSSYSFSTSALGGGEWSASLPGRALAPGKRPPVSIVQEAGWAPDPVWTQRIEENSFSLCRRSNLDRLVVQPVAGHYTDSGTLSLPVDARLYLKVGVPLASDVFFPTGLHFESRCLRRYAFCQRCPLCWLISRIFRDNFMVSGMILGNGRSQWTRLFLRGILMVVWSLDRADCGNDDLTRLESNDTHSQTGWLIVTYC